LYVDESRHGCPEHEEKSVVCPVTNSQERLHYDGHYVKTGICHLMIFTDEFKGF